MEKGHLTLHGNAWVKNDLSKIDKVLGKLAFKMSSKRIEDVSAYKCKSCSTIELVAEAT